MRRIGLVILALVAAALPAGAQSSWVPWSQTGNGNSNRFSSASRSARHRAKPVKTQPRVVLAARSNQDDEEDDGDFFFGSPFGSQRDDAPATRRSPVQYPSVIEGGPRPEISAQAPPKVAFRSGFSQGSIVIDTSTRSLYYVLGGGTAYRYPISVGRDGFRWQGTETISRVAAWPDWHPPQEMRERDPRLPEVMTGGIRNPLGAKALYLGNTLYRIHGTNDAKSIGYAASSGCFRMMNHHVMHLATLAGAGTTVHVLSHLPSAIADGVRPRSKRQG